MCDLHSGDVKYSIEASNERRAALRLALRQGERRLQAELRELSSELVTFLLNTISRQRSTGTPSTKPESIALADAAKDSSMRSMAVLDDGATFDVEASGLPSLAHSTFSRAIQELFESLVRQVPDIDASETWGRESLLKRTARLRESNRELEQELQRLRTQHFALSERFRKMRAFVSAVKTTLWLSMNAIVQELEANGASASGVLSVVHRFSKEWPDERSAAEEDRMMILSDFQTSSEGQDGASDGDSRTLNLVEELQHARRIEESRRIIAEQVVAEMQASLPLKIAEAVRQATEAARDDSRLFQRMRKEYENRIDELLDAVETLKEESNKRLDDAHRLQEEEQVHGDIVQDEVAALRRTTQLMALQNEKIRNDFVHLKLKALTESQQLTRQLKVATDQLATRREEHVVRAEAEQPLLEKIARLNDTLDTLGADLRFLKTRSEAAVTERQEVVDDNIKLTRELQLARHDLDGVRSRCAVLETNITSQADTIARLAAENSTLTMQAAQARLAFVTDAARAGRLSAAGASALAAAAAAARRRTLDSTQQGQQSGGVNNPRGGGHVTSGEDDLSSASAVPPSNTSDGSSAFPPAGSHQDAVDSYHQSNTAAHSDLSPFESGATRDSPSVAAANVAPGDDPSQLEMRKAGSKKNEKNSRGSVAPERGSGPGNATHSAGGRPGTTAARGPQESPPQQSESFGGPCEQKEDAPPAALCSQSAGGGSREALGHSDNLQLMVTPTAPQRSRPPSGVARHQPGGGLPRPAEDAPTQAIRQLQAAKINPLRLVQALVGAFARSTQPDDISSLLLHGPLEISSSKTGGAATGAAAQSRADEGTQTVAAGFYEVTEAILHEKLLWSNLSREVVDLKKEYDSLIAAAKACCLCADHGGGPQRASDGVCPAAAAASPPPVAAPPTAGQAPHVRHSGTLASVQLRRTVSRPLSARPSNGGRGVCSVPLPHTISVQKLSLVPERYLGNLK
jgi:hypothetical protein